MNHPLYGDTPHSPNNLRRVDIIVPVSEMRKLRLREIRLLAQRHHADKWQDYSENPGVFGSYTSVLESLRVDKCPMRLIT